MPQGISLTLFVLNVALIACFATAFVRTFLEHRHTIRKELTKSAAGVRSGVQSGVKSGVTRMLTSRSTSRHKGKTPLWMSSTLFDGCTTDASGRTSDAQRDIEMVDGAQGSDAARVQVTSNPIFGESAPDRIEDGRPVTPNPLHADGACDAIGGDV